MKWYRDRELISDLPSRYKAYAAYSRLAGDSESRRVPGGSFLLRILRKASVLARRSTVARIHGIDGLVVVTDFADERVLEVIHEIRGENPEHRVMKALLKEGATFIDVGANFGTFSLLASRLVGPSGRVIAVEPQARLVSMIEESLRRSDVANCEIHAVACGSVVGEHNLLVPENDSGRAGFLAGFSGRSAHDSHPVRTTTLDRLLENTSVSDTVMIKIDVEGSEMDVLDGGQRFIRDRMPAIMIELNPWSAAAAARNPREIVDRLVSFGYSSFSSAEDYPKTADWHETPLTRQMNLVATR
jgi:FkbM family methyltransferase